MLDTKAIALALAPIVKQHVEAATAPLIQRIADLEAKSASPPRGPDIEALIEQMSDDIGRLENSLAAAQETFDSKAAAIEVRVQASCETLNSYVAGPLSSEVQEAIDAAVTSGVERAAAALPAPQNGKDADMEAVKAHCETIIAALPKPENGKDGCDAVDALQDKDGNLIISFSDGRMKNVGRVAGKDGDHGTDGQSWEDMEVRRTGPRTIELSFDHGERRNTFELEFPVPLYRGVFSEGEAYQSGDMVTWAGSLWHCNDATVDKPGEGAKAWTLAAKRGRDGKDFAGPQAKPGTVKI